MSRWLKKGDKVIVIAGNEKGKTGDVISRKEDRVLVQGINIRKRHAKRKTKAPGAEILEMEVAIHISNVSLCNADGKPIKVKARLDKAGNKELYYRENDKDVSFRQLSKNS